MLRSLVIFILFVCPVQGLAVHEPCNTWEDWRALLIVGDYEFGREAARRFLDSLPDQQRRCVIESTRAAYARGAESEETAEADEGIAGPVATEELREQMLKEGFKEKTYKSPQGRICSYFMKLGLRQWVCPCGNSYDRVNSFEYHILRHLDERPYRCQWCEDAFFQDCDRRRHEKRQHP